MVFLCLVIFIPDLWKILKIIAKIILFEEHFLSLLKITTVADCKTKWRQCASGHCAPHESVLFVISTSLEAQITSIKLD